MQVRAPHQQKFVLGEFTFDSQFDSGNLQDAKQISESQFLLWVGHDLGRPDHRCWLRFRIQGPVRGKTLTFTVMNLGPQLSRIKDILLPVVQEEGYQWRRVAGPLLNVQELSNGFQFTYKHKFRTQAGDFALFFPWSLQDNEEFLVDVANRCKGSRVYFHKSVLCLSKEGRPVPLVTISSFRQRLKGCESIDSPQAFPAGGPPRRFGPKKTYVIFTARVHPGQTPSSHVMNGLINKLVQESEQGRLLRQHFVFHLVPIVNPDGLADGHHRVDSVGVNLNRTFITPRKEHSPIHVIKALALGLHRQARLYAYLDLHAHPSRKGFFVYGNHSSLLAMQLQVCLFPRLLQLNCQDFDYEDCTFSAAGMGGKEIGENGTREGAGRVYLHKKLKHPRCWTLQFGYVRSETKGVLPDQRKPLHPVRLSQYISLPRKESRQLYQLQSYHRMAQGILTSLLDLKEVLPNSRLAYSPFTNLAGLKLYTAAMLMKALPYRYQPQLKPLLKLLDQDIEQAGLQLSECWYKDPVPVSPPQTSPRKSPGTQDQTGLQDAKSRRRIDCSRLSAMKCSVVTLKMPPSRGVSVSNSRVLPSRSCRIFTSIKYELIKL